MFGALTNRFQSPDQHLQRLLGRVAEDVRKRAMRVGPTFDDDFDPLFILSKDLLGEILGSSSSSVAQAPVVTWERKVATENDLAAALHLTYSSLLALLSNEHPSRCRRLAQGLSACFAGTGQATAPYDQATATLRSYSSDAVLRHLRDALLRILRRRGLQGERQEAAFGQRFSLLTAYISARLRKIYPATQAAIY